MNENTLFKEHLMLALLLEVDQYNEKYASMGEKALLQWYEADSDKDMDSKSACIPKKKKKREISCK